jgi:hypothetical protein
MPPSGSRHVAYQTGPRARSIVSDRAYLCCVAVDDGATEGRPIACLRGQDGHSAHGRYRLIDRGERSQWSHPRHNSGQSPGPGGRGAKIHPGPPESQGGWGRSPDPWDEFLVPNSAETSCLQSPGPQHAKALFPNRIIDALFVPNLSKVDQPFGSLRVDIGRGQRMGASVGQLTSFRFVT